MHNVILTKIYKEMITHKDKLQNQIKKLQSLINDILESELKEKLSIVEG